MSRLRFVSFFGLFVLASAPAAAADPRAAPQRSLRQRLGVDAARPWLRAEASELRQRAFERLASSGTSAAISLLAHALEPDGEARDARERLVVVRGLAARAGEEAARSALIRAMAGVETRDEPKGELVRRTAALALARSRDPRAVEVLAQALRQAGRTSETARLAFAAHPPPSIGALFGARGAPTLALLELLAELGDPRASDFVDSVVERSPPALRPAALGTLFTLAPERALIAAGRLADDGSVAVRFASTRILALGHAPDAPRRLAALLADPATADAAVLLALEARSSELGPVLAGAPVVASRSDAWLGALGRAGGPAALARLDAALREPERRWVAAYALALSPDDAASDILARALTVPTSRRDAVRAAALREAESGRSVSGLDRALAELHRSSVPADRAAWAFSASLRSPELAAELVKGRDPVEARAAARTALEPSVARAAAERLGVEHDPLQRASLALCLADPDAAELVPTRTLVELLETRGAAAHLAAHALAARDDEELRPRLEELLKSGDPVLRAHVALGLARSRQASTVGLLAVAYRFEVDPRVRRAVVLALALRKEPARVTTLRLAADLDPDREVRRRARAALAPDAVHPPEKRGTAWLALPPAATGDGELLVLETATGLALPLAPDPDGCVTIAGLPVGRVGARVAGAAPSAAEALPPR